MRILGSPEVPGGSQKGERHGKTLLMFWGVLKSRNDRGVLIFVGVCVGGFEAILRIACTPLAV